jgi:uncharacterized protein
MQMEVNTLRFAAVGAVLLGFAGCAASPPPAAAITSLIEVRQTAVVVQQWDLSCAAAALATVLQFQHGRVAPEREIVEAMLRKTDPLRVRVRGGFSLLDLKRHADSRGLRGIGYANLTTEDLVKFAPIIVPVNLTGFPHFVVFRGMIGDQVLLADPAYGNRTMHIDRFSTNWLGANGFIVAQADGSPAPPGRLAVRVDDVPSMPAIALRDAFR